MNSQREAVKDWWKVTIFLTIYFLFQIGYSIVALFNSIFILKSYPHLEYLLFLLIPLRFAINCFIGWKWSQIAWRRPIYLKEPRLIIEWKTIHLTDPKILDWILSYIVYNVLLFFLAWILSTATISYYWTIGFDYFLLSALLTMFLKTILFSFDETYIFNFIFYGLVLVLPFIFFYVGRKMAGVFQTP